MVLVLCVYCCVCYLCVVCVCVCSMCSMCSLCSLCSLCSMCFCCNVFVLFRLVKHRIVDSTSGQPPTVRVCSIVAKEYMLHSNNSTRIIILLPTICCASRMTNGMIVVRERTETNDYVNIASCRCF